MAGMHVKMECQRPPSAWSDLRGFVGVGGVGVERRFLEGRQGVDEQLRHNLYEHHGRYPQAWMIIAECRSCTLGAYSGAGRTISTRLPLEHRRRHHHGSRRVSRSVTPKPAERLADIAGPVETEV
jgi:hypothetical protein